MIQWGAMRDLPWSIGPFKTKEEAIAAGKEECDDVSPWYYKIKEV